MMTLSMAKWVFVVLCCLLVILCALGITLAIRYAVKKHVKNRRIEFDIDFLRWKTQRLDSGSKGYNDRLYLIENKVNYLMEEHDKSAKPVTEDPAKSVADQIAGAILTGIDKAVKGP